MDREIADPDPHAARRAQSERRKRRYDDALEPHAASLVALIEELIASPLDATSARRIFARHPRRGERAGAFAKSDVLRAFRRFAPERGWDPIAAAPLLHWLRLKPVRTDSGVVPFAVLTRPFPCPGECVFCPNDVRMPKSYLSMEPGAQRGTQNAFDPYAQTWNRLRAFFNNGHRLGKVELIVIGGTFSAYPEPYQRWFTKRCFDALNDFDGDRPMPAPGPTARDFLAVRSAGGSYNAEVAAALRRFHGTLEPEGEDAGWDEVEAAQRANERAEIRCVGLSFETRPDRVDEAEVLRLRRLGATKVQLGLQSLDDAVLARNRRGHDVECSRRAIALLRRAGFKVQAHWMPNLMGATPESDRRDAERLFADPRLSPDELKIYPCVLIESAGLMRHHASGEWRPYPPDVLADVVAHALAQVPRSCRVNRVIRDIPAHDVVAGNRSGNLRETAEQVARDRGVRLQDIRARQLRRPLERDEALAMRELRCDGGATDERFLSLETRRDELVAFARLSLPHEPAFCADLDGCAILREVHVYGEVAPLGLEGALQHRGSGRALVLRAAGIARAAGFAALAVISAVGTREYYRRLGFVDRGLYPRLPLDR